MYFRNFKNVNVSSSFKPQNKAYNLLCNFKPITPSFNRKGIIYCIPCLNCDSAYIGEAGQTFKTCISENRSAFKKGEFKIKSCSSCLRHRTL